MVRALAELDRYLMRSCNVLAEDADVTAAECSRVCEGRPWLNSQESQHAVPGTSPSVSWSCPATPKTLSCNSPWHIEPVSKTEQGELRQGPKCARQDIAHPGRLQCLRWSPSNLSPPAFSCSQALGGQPDQGSDGQSRLKPATPSSLPCLVSRQQHQDAKRSSIHLWGVRQDLPPKALWIWTRHT